MTSLRRALINAHGILKLSSLSRTEAFLRHPSFPLVSPMPENRWISRFSSSGDISSDIDLSNEESKRRLFNRLLYRSKQRGFLELDLVLGKWVEENIHSLDENGIRALVHVLDLENPDLWRWLTGQEKPPEAVIINPVFSALKGQVMGNLYVHSSPETRATPGQPWVRGWEDIKKGRDGPIAGNQ